MTSFIPGVVCSPMNGQLCKQSLLKQASPHTYIIVTIHVCPLKYFCKMPLHFANIMLQLYEEIMSVCHTEEITTEQVNELKYLDRCLNEAMRLYPQAIR